MKKTILTRKHLKAVVAVALAAAMSLPVTANLKTVKAADEADAAALPAAVELFDFNEGLKEYYQDPDVQMKVVKTENLLVHKEEDEKEDTDKFDSNNIMVMIGAASYYYKATVSNQPSTHVDAERGTVLSMGKTVNIDAVVKSQSAAIEGDDVSTAKLDAEIPVPEGEDKTVQPAMTVRSEIKFKSPLANVEGDRSVAMWVKIPTVESVDNSLAGKWHYVVASKSAENATLYVDGVATEDAVAAAKLTDWVTNGEDTTEGGEVVSGSTIYIGGYTDNASLFADALGIVDANAEIMLDDIAMYDVALSAEQVAAIYADASAEVVPVANKIKFDSFDEVSTLQDENLPGMTAGAKSEIISSTVNGSTKAVLSVPANKDITTSTGVYMKNPFAGKSLDGATISFWTKQEKRSGKNSTGDEETSVLSIIDSVKNVENEKSGAKGEAFSMISYTSYVNTVFKEAFSNDAVGNKLANTYFYSVSDEDRAKVNRQDWYYVTLVMTNSGIKTYINGVCYDNAKVDDNGKSIATGPRFCDGDFQRAQDDVDILTKYNIFGGSNNQYATSLMTFLQYEDTNLFLGYVPVDGSLNQKTNPTFYAELRTFDVALTDAQVSELYKNNAVYDTETSGEFDKVEDSGNNNNGGNNNTNNGNNNANNGNGNNNATTAGFKAGDADVSGKVDLTDAKLVLKLSLGIDVKITDQGKANADYDKSGKVDLNDAKYTLKEALGIKVTLGK